MPATEENPLSLVQPPEVAAEEIGKRSGRRWPVAGLIAVALALCGIGLRLWLPVGFHGAGFDEKIYRNYVVAFDQRGLGDYDTITQAYLVDQRRADSICKLPPTRFLYVFCGWIWKRAAFGDAPPVQQAANAEHDPALVSLHRVSCFFSILLLLLSGVAAWRMLGPEPALVVLGLMAVAPLQLHMAGHALIDGFFAFWAMLVLWSLWENLRHPKHAGWLTVFGTLIALMVLTKENAFFVFAAGAGLLAVNHWAQFGTVNRRLVFVGFGGALGGLVILVWLAGSPQAFFEVYHLFVAKAQHLDYAIQTQDGPWQRYLIDELIVNPFVLLLAIGGMFGVTRKAAPALFLLGFLVFSYGPMCQVRYGMNLRFGTIWDFPLCALAAGQLLNLSEVFGRWRRAALGAALAGICGYELWQYWLFFVHDRLYELPTESLLRAVNILKS